MCLRVSPSVLHTKSTKKVITGRTRSPCRRVPIASCSQPRASLFCAWLINSNNSSPCRTHTHLVILHSNKECLHESCPPQMEQLLFCAMFLWCRTSPIGIDCFTSLHRKTRTLHGTLTFHGFVYSFCFALMSDGLSLCSIQLFLLSRLLTNIRYADLTENTPDFS